MQQCWRVDPDMRPAFSELVTTISTLLKQAEGSEEYARNYTTQLDDDYTDKEKMDRQAKNYNEWAAIIPHIREDSFYVGWALIPLI